MKITKHIKGTIYTEAAIVTDMPNDEYHAHPGISNSGLSRLDRSPSHYKNAPKNAPTRNMEIGTAIHTAILENDRFLDEYVLLPEVKDRRQSEYKKAVEVFDSERVLVGAEVENVLGMCKSIHSQENITSRIYSPGWNELSVFAPDTETGIMCRCRFDYLSEDFAAIDLKKTQDARADAFSRSVYSYFYHVQAAFYTDVFLWATGKELLSFEFLAVEEKQPHGCKIYKLGEASIDLGRETYRKNLNLYSDCAKYDEWPSYECSETEEIDVPYWVLSQREYNELDEMT